MALGICDVCGKLVSIKPKGYRFDGGKQRWWFPVSHEDEQGRLCAGEKKGL